MSQPTPGDVHVSRELSDWAFAYIPENMIADEVFPIIPMDKQSDYYYIWTKDFWFRDHVKVRGPSAGYPQGGLELSSTTYFCINKGLAFPIADEVVENQDEVIDIEDAGAEWLGSQFGLHREIALAAAIMDNSAWTTETTLSGGSQWSDFANSDPIGDVDTGIQTIEKLTGKTPNRLTISAEGWDKLKNHPDLLDRYKHTEVGILTPELVAKVLGIEKILVGRGAKNTAAEAATFAGAYIWPKNALLTYLTATPGKRIANAGYTFVWKRATGFPLQIKNVRDELHSGGTLLGDQAFDQKVTGADCGYEIINCVA